MTLWPSIRRKRFLKYLHWCVLLAVSQSAARTIVCEGADSSFDTLLASTASRICRYYTWWMMVPACIHQHLLCILSVFLSHGLYTDMDEQLYHSRCYCVVNTQHYIILTLLTVRWDCRFNDQISMSRFGLFSESNTWQIKTVSSYPCKYPIKV